MACVAEGVETREQVEALLEAGCNFAQGFYYDAPMQVTEFRLKYLGGGGGEAASENGKELE